MDNSQAAAQIVDSIVQATAALHHPGASQQQRTQAVQFFEQLKSGEIHTFVLAVSVLTRADRPLEVQISAYSLLEFLVRNRWAELSGDERNHVTRLAYEHLRDVSHLGAQAAWALKSKAALLLAAVVRQQGPDGYAAILPQLLASAPEGPLQAELCCLVLQFVAEDITQFEDRVGDWKRNFLSALLASCDTVFPFIVQLLERQYQAAAQASAQGGADAARAHASVVSAALATLAAFMDWAPLARVLSSSIVPACSFFLAIPDFRDNSLAVLRQIAGRVVKASNREEDDQEGRAYSALMDAVADALLGAAAAALAPDRVGDLDYEGGAEEHGRRLATTLVQLADMHLGALSGQQRKYQLLECMLGFTRHPYLQLSFAALPFWHTVLREYGAAPGQARAAARHGDALPPPPPPPSGLPAEAVQALVAALAEQLLRTVVRSDDLEAASLPIWVDTPGEYKELCSMYRGQVKVLVRGAALLAPQAALTSAGAFIARVVADAAGGGGGGGAAGALPAAQRHVSLEAAALVLESVMPSACDVVATGGSRGEGPAVREALGSLLQMLLAQRFDDYVLVMLHARCLEAFARFVSISHDALAPLLQASFECLQALPLECSGQLPPPPKVSLQWKEQAMARVSMAKVLLTMAKEAPGAFLQHLEQLVSSVQSLWERGLLREGEKVVLYEGLMAAAGGGGPELQSQLIEWLLRPVRTTWTSPAWLAHLDSPAAFSAQYLQFQVAPDGTVAVGSRPERWALYNEMHLFERALRRTPIAPAAGAAPPPALPHPFSAHLDWMVPPLLKVVRCLHGLSEPQMQAALAALAPAFGMDPVERALRTGGEASRDAAKKSEEDAGTLAGTNLSALRFWMRAIRECSYMTVAHCANHTGDAFWNNAALAAVVPAALTHDVALQDLRHVRVLIRHSIQPLVQLCPLQLRGPWLAPLLAGFLPHMHERLCDGWRRLAGAQAGGGAAGGGAQAAAGGAAADTAALSNEVVEDSLLRELTRDHMTLLAKVAVFESPVLGGVTEGGGGSGGGGGGGGSAAGDEVRGAGGDGVRESPPPPPPESALETLWAADARIAQAVVATAVAALGWPDTMSACKAALVCRKLVQLSESSHPELEATLPEILRATIVALLQVWTVTIQAELLNVVRQVLVVWLPRGSQHVSGLLLQLPGMSPQLLSSFQKQLQAVGSEKDQRNLVKQLLLESGVGGEQARSLLNAVSKVQPVANMSEPRQKQAGGAIAPADEICLDWSGTGIAI